jgi:hypothetical protein
MKDDQSLREHVLYLLKGDVPTSISMQSLRISRFRLEDNGRGAVRNNPGKGWSICALHNWRCWSPRATPTTLPLNFREGIGPVRPLLRTRKPGMKAPRLSARICEPSRVWP